MSQFLKMIVLAAVLFLGISEEVVAGQTRVNCSILTSFKSGEMIPQQILELELQDGPYGSRFGSVKKTFEGDLQVSLSVTQMGLGGPRTVWRLEVQGRSAKPQVSSGEVSSQMRISHLVMRQELEESTLEVSCPLES